MIIDSKLSKQEYVRLNIALIFRNVSTYIFLAFGSIYLLFSLWIMFDWGDYFLLLVWGVFSVFTVAYYWFAIYRATNSKENGKMYLPAHYEFNENDIKITTPTGKSETTWAIFVKWRFLAGHYMLYISRIQFIPIKAENVGDKKEFEKMLREKVKKP